MLTIDLETARRFILGKQGLWPGRRWRGQKGTEKAMHAMEYLQLDPLQIIARSQDLALHSRVIDYRPGLWENLTYCQRRFFDWGDWLAVRPMEELPYWRVVMQRDRVENPRLRLIARDHAGAIAELRTVLQERGILSNRDFDMSTRTRTESYRDRKDSALALYYLWQTGEAMTHHRDRFERACAPTDQVAPANLIRESSEDEADRFLVLKEVAFGGLSRIARTSDSFRRGQPDQAAKKLLGKMLADGDLIEVKVDGWKPVRYALGSDAEALHEMSNERIPKAWKPLEMTTIESKK
jgi:uncharacterized protein